MKFIKGDLVHLKLHLSFSFVYYNYRLRAKLKNVYVIVAFTSCYA